MSPKYYLQINRKTSGYATGRRFSTLNKKENTPIKQPIPSIQSENRLSLIKASSNLPVTK